MTIPFGFPENSKGQKYCSLANAQRKNMNNTDRQMTQAISVIREMSSRIHLAKSIEVRYFYTFMS